ncbi:alkaline phosphatase D family protein [Paraglaciecola hydrolytica]|uniref:Twin-arginine translocation pathway signal n=1 Tax=Paraglaciecola hydrolytica TaxID=1799789 RepID=A0A136A0V3_9ALTE|nr:alkaline phosphatase D family protein [Paraglaciecola hydrolytica]KXI28866.1 twin-arginine translocation pathway signal [Paraglaciecola hydrolytica]
MDRRKALKLIASSLAVSGVACTNTIKPNVNSANKNLPSNTRDKWQNTHNRTWLGGEYWSNPMEDWHLVDGAAECKSINGNRTVHSLTHRLENTNQSFQMSTSVQAIGGLSYSGGAGFRLGVNNEVNDYRSSCFVQKGLDVGIIGNELEIAGKRTPLSGVYSSNDVINLSLTGKPQAGAMKLSLTAILAATNERIGQMTLIVPAAHLFGNVALVSNFKVSSHPKELSPRNRYRFSNWQMQGDAFVVTPTNKFGPILWSMYSLNDTRTAEGFVLKLSAFTGPMGHDDNQFVQLQIKQDGKWRSHGQSQLDPDAWVATFRIANWNAQSDSQFRVVYQEKHQDGSETPDVWEGLIKANPQSKQLKMAALTCQNDYSFPYTPVEQNVRALQPDIVFFSGDQIYESHGGFGIVRAPFESAIENYLRKFYQFGWAFREVMRNQPTICLPDDHDVLQGNLWGEGGVLKKDPDSDPTASLTGGYIETARFVNAVHRTCTSHHPDPYDTTLSVDGIGTYYSDMVYGNVGFAILADRQWKNGPEQAGVVVGETGVGESPTSINPAINPPNSQLLGEKQEAFLDKWATDWRGHKLKAVLSQTVFAGISTHQPTPERYLKYDFDSSGWPAPARDRAVSIMRKSKALHICGDTHLGSLAQYGVEQQRDSNWSFCTPAISAGWPRWWLPDQVGIPHQNRPSHGLPQTGEFLDSFGNKMYVYAVGVPEVGKSPNRYIQAHEKGSGFGFIIFDTEKLSYTLHAYRYLVDVSKNDSDKQFPGWPVTIHQDENQGHNRLESV